MHTLWSQLCPTPPLHWCTIHTSTAILLFNSSMYTTYRLSIEIVVRNPQDIFNRFFVIKCDKSESSRFASTSKLIHHHHGRTSAYFTVFRKVLRHRFFCCFPTQCSNKQFTATKINMYNDSDQEYKDSRLTVAHILLGPFLFMWYPR